MFSILGTGVKCKISLNEPDKVFHPGDMMEGYIELHAKRDIHIDRITTNLHGATMLYIRSGICKGASGFRGFALYEPIHEDELGASGGTSQHSILVQRQTYVSVRLN